MEDSTLERMMTDFGLIGSMTIDVELKTENRPEDGYQPSKIGYLYFMKGDQLIVREVAMAETDAELEKERQTELNMLNAELQQRMYVKREGNVLKYTSSQ
jgi:hypothetical protein